MAEEPPVHRREALVHVHDLRYLELPYKSVAELLRDLSGHTPPSRYLPVLVVSLSLSLSLSPILKMQRAGCPRRRASTCWASSLLAIRKLAPVVSPPTGGVHAMLALAAVLPVRVS